MDGSQIENVRFTVLVPATLLERAKERARLTNTTVSREVRQHLAEWVLRPMEGLGAAYAELLVGEEQGEAEP